MKNDSNQAREKKKNEKRPYIVACVSSSDWDSEQTFAPQTTEGLHTLIGKHCSAGNLYHECNNNIPKTMMVGAVLFFNPSSLLEAIYSRG